MLEGTNTVIVLSQSHRQTNKTGTLLTNKTGALLTLERAGEVCLAESVVSLNKKIEVL